jgi:N-acetylmuramoyl-L-alanine amidase
LDLARRMRVHLSHAGLKVWLTRDNDRKVDLSQRCRKAAEWEADLFVSLHANQAANKEAQGAETYVLPATGSPSTSNKKPSELAREAYPGNRHDAANTVLGYAVQNALLSETGAVDRGLKRARFVVLREAPCPAVLVECGFLSNGEEAARLESDAYREQLAQGLSRGVMEYVRLVRQARVREP